MNKAPKKFIPAGMLPHIYNAKSSETANLVKEAQELNKNINLSIRKHCKKSGQSTQKTANLTAKNSG